MKDLQLAVVGPTGVVGREVLSTLLEEEFPAEQLTLLGSERSEGTEVEYGEESLEVEKASADAFRGKNAVIFATPAEVSRTLAPAAQAAGAWAIDLSEAFRGDPKIPLVLPGLNDQALDASFTGRIVCVPGALTAGLLLPLAPLRSSFGLSAVQATIMAGASLAGQRGIDELEKQTTGLLSGKEIEPVVFPHRLAFNLVPQVGELSGAASAEERAVSQEASRLWADPPGPPAISLTAVQAPIFHGVLLTVYARLDKPASIDEVRSALKSSPALKLLDSPSERVYPMPMLALSDPTVHVGRLRALPSGQGWIGFVAAVDNAGRGAAWNAVKISHALLGRQ